MCLKSTSLRNKENSSKDLKLDLTDASGLQLIDVLFAEVKR